MPTIPNTNQNYTPLAPGQAAAYGTSGSAVSAYQQQLNQQNAGQPGWTPLVVDGLYGPLTQAASSFNSGTSTTPAQLYGDFNAPTGSYESEEAKAARLAQENYLSGIANPDQNSIYNNTLSRFQAEIDAVNKMYADELGRAKIAGTGRLGSRTAISARRGLIGSDFGEASFQDTENANEQVYQSIERERAAKVAGILSQAKSDASAEYAKKREEFIKGIDARLAYYKGEDERKITNSQKAAQLLIDKGVDIKNIKPDELKKLASYYGITEDMIGSTYTSIVSQTAKTKKEAEEKRKQELEDDLIKKGIQTVGKDSSGFIYNPKTKKYERVSGTGVSSNGNSFGNVTTDSTINLKPYEAFILRNVTDKDAGAVLDSFRYGYNAAPDKASYLRDYAVSYLKNKPLENYNSAEDIELAMSNVSDALASGDFKSGPFRSIGNQVLFYVGAQSPYYDSIKTLFSKGKAEERLRLFGASLTTGEQGAARDFLPDSKDPSNVLKFKIDTMISAAQLAKDRIVAQALGLPYSSSVQSYLGTQKKLLADLKSGKSIVGNQSTPSSSVPEFDMSQLSPEQLNELISSGLIQG